MESLEVVPVMRRGVGVAAVVGQELSPPAELGDVPPNIHVSEEPIYNDLSLQANSALQISFWAFSKYAKNFPRRCKMRENLL